MEMLNSRKKGGIYGNFSGLVLLRGLHRKSSLFSRIVMCSVKIKAMEFCKPKYLQCYYIHE